MSRKRVLSTTLMDIELASPDYEDYDCEYLRPGYYCTPQAVQRTHPAPYNYATLNMESCIPCCTTATYVVDAFGRIFYMSDIGHRLEAPSFTVPFPTNHFEIPIMPHIDEDDYYDPPESPFKRHKFEEESDNGEECSSLKGECKTQKCTSNVYRSKEGYLVEEPVDSNDTNQVKKNKKSPHGK